MAGEVIQVIRCECPVCGYKHVFRVDYTWLNNYLDHLIEELEEEVKATWKYYRENPDKWLRS